MTNPDMNYCNYKSQPENNHLSILKFPITARYSGPSKTVDIDLHACTKYMQKKTTRTSTTHLEGMQEDAENDRGERGGHVSPSSILDPRRQDLEDKALVHKVVDLP
jgi:hypothetical protein